MFRNVRIAAVAEAEAFVAFTGALDDLAEALAAAVLPADFAGAFAAFADVFVAAFVAAFLAGVFFDETLVAVFATGSSFP
jgi:hypothetical protein